MGERAAAGASGLGGGLLGLSSTVKSGSENVYLDIEKLVLKVNIIFYGGRAFLQGTDANVELRLQLMTNLY